MKPSDIRSEIVNVIRLADEIYSMFGLHYHLELSTKPEKNTIGSDAEWEHATQCLKEALDEVGKEYQVNEGDGAFYGPKIDFHIRDAIQRTWQCGTIQLDMALPERFALEYTDHDGERKRPVMIHRAIYGSIERFFGILVEHFAGKFPLWISPQQVRVIPVADRHLTYARRVGDKIMQEGFLCDVDESNESVSKKVRNAQINQINYILTVGDREEDNQTITVRTRDNVVHGEIFVDRFLPLLQEEKEKRSLTSLYSNL